MIHVFISTVLIETKLCNIFAAGTKLSFLTVTISTKTRSIMPHSNKLLARKTQLPLLINLKTVTTV